MPFKPYKSWKIKTHIFYAFEENNIKNGEYKMKEYHPEGKAVYVLNIWTILISLLLSLFAGIILTYSIIAGIITFLIIVSLTLAVVFFVIPAFIKNKRIEVSDKRIIISGGIIYKHYRIIKREKIIYVSQIKSPLAAMFGVCSIRLSSVGSSFFIPLLSYEKSEELMLLI